MECIKVDISNKKTIYTQEKIPKIENEADVIIEVAECGICGTDLHIIHGKFDAKDQTILGHEMVGTIFDIYDGHSEFKKGDRVAINPNPNCRLCIPCRRKKTNFCVKGGLRATSGIMNDGGWAQYCKVHISLISKLPDTLSFDQAVICEPLSCIIHGLDRLSDLQIGLDIMIIGAGIIGLLWSCVLHLLGHKKVIISEPNEGRRKTLNNLELGFKCLPWNEILEFKKANFSYSVDLCIDCSGNSDAMAAVFPLLNSGAVFLMFGVATPEKSISIYPYEIFKKELTILGANINTPECFERAISMMESMSTRYLTPEKLNMKSYPLKDHEKALQSFQSETYSKIVFKIKDVL